jgi:hypothetical protein
MASSFVPPASYALIGCPVTEKLERNNFPLWRAQVLSAIRGVEVEHLLDASTAAMPENFIPKAKETPDELILNPD